MSSDEGCEIIEEEVPEMITDEEESMEDEDDEKVLTDEE